MEDRCAWCGTELIGEAIKHEGKVYCDADCLSEDIGAELITVKVKRSNDKDNEN